MEWRAPSYVLFIDVYTFLFEEVEAICSVSLCRHVYHVESESILCLDVGTVCNQ